MKKTKTTCCRSPQTSVSQLELHSVKRKKLFVGTVNCLRETKHVWGSWWWYKRKL